MGILSLGGRNVANIDVPPPTIAPPPVGADRVGGVISTPRKTPPTFVYTQRREPHMGPSYLMAPWDNYETFYDLNVGWQEAPDPIRQSPFYAEGNKIHPWARMNIVSNIAIGSIEAVDDQTFHIGKLIGYLRTPTYQGKQLPSVIRANIEESLPSTYGSQYIVRGVQPATGAVSATGFTEPTSSSTDGYPY